MPWCPKCNAEYGEGFQTCADCGEALADEKPVVAEDLKTPPRPQSAFVKTALAFAVLMPVFPVCLYAVCLSFNWLAPRQWLCPPDVKLSACAWLSAAALAGFVTGMLLRRTIRAVHLYIASTALGALLLGLARPERVYWPAASDLPFAMGMSLVLPQMTATLTSSWGIRFVKERRSRYLLQLVGFLALLLAASLLIYPLWKLLAG